MATKAKDDAPAPANNLRLWERLGKTDPRHTKGFTRGGGFKGTAMKPMWQNKLLTETFGPCGIGWGFAKPEFQLVDGAKNEKLVYCTVTAWYVPDPAKPDEVAHLYGIGGDKAVVTFSSGPSSDDEAFKKAFTDAIGNAFKFIGVGADVHMGLFDDSKYVQDLRQEFEAADDVLGKEVDDVLEGIKACVTLDALTGKHRPLVEKYKELLLDAEREGEAGVLVSTYKARRAALTPKPTAVPKESPPADETAPATETAE